MVLVIAAVLAIAVTSFAGWGRGHMGYGYHMGPGYGMRGGWGPGYGGQGYQSDLSEEDIARLDEERRSFFEATSDLREQLYQKELELRSELAKPEPDAKKAAGLQKEISKLEGEFDPEQAKNITVRNIFRAAKDLLRNKNFIFYAVGVVQLVRTSDCGSEGRGFESHHPPQRKKGEHFMLTLFKLYRFLYFFKAFLACIYLAAASSNLPCL